MSKSAREKGKRGERKWRDRLREEGFQAERTGWMQSRGGGTDVPDVQSEDLDVHFEVKTVERLNLNAAIDQAQGDAGGKPVAIVYQQSRREPLIIMPASDWFRAVRGDLLVGPNPTNNVPPPKDDGEQLAK